MAEDIINDEILAEQLPTIQIDTEESEEKRPGAKKHSEPLWLSVTETSKVCGVNKKTIRRAIQAKALKYKVTNNRYHIEFGSVMHYLNETKKLKNKLDVFGIGQYVDKWRK